MAACHIVTCFLKIIIPLSRPHIGVFINGLPKKVTEISKSRYVGGTGKVRIFLVENPIFYRVFALKSSGIALEMGVFTFFCIKDAALSR